MSFTIGATVKQGVHQDHDCTGGASANNTFILRRYNSLTLDQRGVYEPASSSASFVDILLNKAKEQFSCGVMVE